MPQVRVPNFSPATNGFHFINFYPHEPTLTVPLPMGRVLALGDAANGLCGGMAFAVADYYAANLAIPDLQAPPEQGTPLYNFIVKRLFDSFNLPFGIARYLELMHPVFPDISIGFGIPSRSTVMLNDEWPRIQASLDAGHLVPLGLVKVKSDLPDDLGKNHQVLAYGYDLNDSALTIHLYDPNYAGDTPVSMSLSVANAQAPVGLTYSPAETVYCFFHTPYVPVAPPAT